MKTRKYKVDEWVLYNILSGSLENSRYSWKAVILNICSIEDYYDYEIYVEQTEKFKKVREEHLFPLKQL